MSEEKRVIKASDILADLQAGITREEIKTKYDLNRVQLAAIFKSPSLKNKRTIKEKGTSFVFEDDLVATSTLPASEAVEPAEPATEASTPATQPVEDAPNSFFSSVEEAENVQEELTPGDLFATV